MINKTASQRVARADKIVQFNCLGINIECSLEQVRLRSEPHIVYTGWNASVYVVRVVIPSYLRTQNRVVATAASKR